MVSEPYLRSRSGWWPSASAMGAIRLMRSTPGKNPLNCQAQVPVGLLGDPGRDLGQEAVDLIAGKGWGAGPALNAVSLRQRFRHLEGIVRG